MRKNFFTFHFTIPYNRDPLHEERVRFYEKKKTPSLKSRSHLERFFMVTGHFGPKPSRPLDTSAPSHLGPKPSRPHLKINSWTLRQGECLSPLLFSLFLNDIEEQFILSGLDGLDVNMFKMFLLLYADDIVLFANSASELQDGLDLMSDYCKRWKLKINISKTKVMIFRKGGMLPRNLSFYYDDEPLEIVKKFNYLGIVFTTGGSFAEAQMTLAGQSQKAIFKMKKYLYKFTFLSPRHKLELFDKLITPILNYGCEVWGFIQANAIERVHLQCNVFEI